MFMYKKPQHTFNIAENMNCKPGDGLVRLGPDTDCKFVCEDVPEDGLIPVSGCRALDQCVLDDTPVPCIDYVDPCDPCRCSGSAGEGGLTAEEVTTIATEVATSPEVLQCTVDAVTAAAAAK